mmetsp:Transcript_43292/g.115806  ORF Transcript_43292/g.115806 Transcript_43292/m.115806 type:complete len:124 (+) Transcript_43292:116-487(+)
MKEQGEPGEKRGKNREGAERENKGDREMREVKNSQEPLLDAALHRAAAPRSAGRKLLRIHLVKFGRVQNRVEADGDARDAEGPENGAAQTCYQKHNNGDAREGCLLFESTQGSAANSGWKGKS